MSSRGRWSLIFFVVAATSGALVILWMTPMMRRMSDLGRGLAFFLGIAISTVFTVAITRFMERLRGPAEDVDSEFPED